LTRQDLLAKICIVAAAAATVPIGPLFGFVGMAAVRFAKEQKANGRVAEAVRKEQSRKDLVGRLPLQAPALGRTTYVSRAGQTGGSKTRSPESLVLMLRMCCGRMAVDAAEPHFQTFAGHRPAFASIDQSCDWP
jgi:hypothetical protein